MKEMECYISEENIKKCFNFTFLQLAKIPEIVQKKKGVPLEMVTC